MMKEGYIKTKTILWFLPLKVSYVAEDFGFSICEIHPQQEYSMWDKIHSFLGSSNTFLMTTSYYKIVTC